MSNKQQWQVVCDESEGVHTQCLYRLKVSGGWLYRFESLVPISENECQNSVALVFVPKPKLCVKARGKSPVSE